MRGFCLCIMLLIGLPSQAQPLNMREAGALTLQNHPTGREAQAQVEADRARYGQSQAPFYPTISAVTGYLTNDQREDAVRSFEQDINLDLVGSQLLADFGKRRHSSEQADLVYKASKRANESVQQTLLSNTGRAYIAALSAAQVVFIQKEALRLAKLRLAEAQRLVEAGKRPRENFSLAESDASTILVSLIDAEAAEKSARVRLGNAMGLAESYTGPLVNCALAYQDFELGPSLSTASESRPDLAGARLLSSAAQSGLWRAEAGYRPDLFLSAGYGFLDKGVTPQDYLWEVRLNLSFPILNEPLLSESINLAEAQKQQALARERAKANDVASEVQAALIESRGDYLKTAAAHNATVKAYSTFILTWTTYRLGKGSARDVSNAQRDLTQAMLTQNQVYTESQLSLLEAYRAMGTLSLEVLPEAEEARYWPLFDQEVSE